MLNSPDVEESKCLRSTNKSSTPEYFPSLAPTPIYQPLRFHEYEILHFSFSMSLFSLSPTANRFDQVVGCSVLLKFHCGGGSERNSPATPCHPNFLFFPFFFSLFLRQCLSYFLALDVYWLVGMLVEFSSEANCPFILGLDSPFSPERTRDDSRTKKAIYIYVSHLLKHKYIFLCGMAIVNTNKKEGSCKGISERERESLVDPRTILVAILPRVGTQGTTLPSSYVNGSHDRNTYQHLPIRLVASLGNFGLS